MIIFNGNGTICRDLTYGESDWVHVTNTVRIFATKLRVRNSHVARLVSEAQSDSVIGKKPVSAQLCLKINESSEQLEITMHRC